MLKYALLHEICVKAVESSYDSLSNVRSSDQEIDQKNVDHNYIYFFKFIDLLCKNIGSVRCVFFLIEVWKYTWIGGNSQLTRKLNETLTWLQELKQASSTM